MMMPVTVSQSATARLAYMCTGVHLCYALCVTLLTVSRRDKITI